MLQEEEGREEVAEGDLEEGRRETTESQRPLAPAWRPWVGQAPRRGVPSDMRAGGLGLASRPAQGLTGPFSKVSWDLPPEATSLQQGHPGPHFHGQCSYPDLGP